MNLTIIKPKKEHTEAVASICASGWRQTAEDFYSETYIRKNIDFWYNLKRVSDDIESGVYTHIALVDSEAAGVIGGGMTAPDVGEIFVFYVDEKYRFQGIGKKLLEALTKEQRKSGAKEQWVSVQEGNQLGIPFYEAKGFTFQKKKMERVETGEKMITLRYMRQI